MKIVVEEDAKLTQVEVTFRAPKIDAEVIDAVSRLKLYEQKITGIEKQLGTVLTLTEITV